MRGSRVTLARRSIAAMLVLLVMLGVVYRVIFDGQVIAGRDVFRLFIPDNALLLDYLREFDWPLWNPYERMGQPFAASMQSQVFYLPRLLTVCLFGPVVATTAMQMVHVVIAACGVAWFLSPLLGRWYTPWVAGVFFAMSPMFTDLAMQQNVVDAAAWTGWLLGAVYRGNARATSVSVAMSLLAASPETTLWQLMLGGLVAWQVRARWVKLVLTTSHGFGLAGVMLIPAAEFTRHSIRGAWSLNSGDWSMSWWQVVGSVWPAFDVPSSEYWGADQHFVSNVFLGTLPVVLALIGALRGPLVTRAISAGGVSLLVFSMGGHLPVVRGLLEMPPFNLFRYPAKAYVGAAFAIAVLAGCGLEAVARAARHRRQRSEVLRYVVAWGAAGLVAAFVLPRLPLRAGALLGAPWVWFVLGSAGVLYVSVPSGWQRGRLVTASIALLALLELVLARSVFVLPEYELASVLSTPASWVGALPAEHQRISAGVMALPETFHPRNGNSITLSRELLIPNRFMEARLESVNGYGAPEPERFERLEQGNARGFFDLAGVTHYLSEDGSAPFADLTLEKTLVEGVGLYSSTTALPRAFVVQRSVVASDEETLRTIEVESGGEPLRHTAFLAAGPVLDGVPCQSEVRSEARGLRHVTYSVEACADGLLVMTDSYFPGWHARVDELETPVLRADYAFRAVAITRGHHRVELRYWPLSFVIGLLVSMISGLLLFPWSRMSLARWSA